MWHLPENVDRWTVSIILIAAMFVGVLGYFFGDRAGFARAMQACNNRPVQSVPMEQP